MIGDFKCVLYIYIDKIVLRAETDSIEGREGGSGSFVSRPGRAAGFLCFTALADVGGELHICLFISSE